MSSRLLASVLILTGCFVWLLGASPVCGAETNVEVVGNPFAKIHPNRIYPRNVWDMQVFNGRIYLGHGCTTLNTGPTAIMSYDPGKKEFVKEYVANDEAILSYRVIGDDLVIPGSDPRGSWAFGNYYRHRKGKWEKVRKIPEGLHCYDVMSYKNRLFAAIGNKKGAAVTEATDNEGGTWKTHQLPRKSRAYSLFEYNDSLFVASNWIDVYVYGDSSFSKVEADWLAGINPRKLSLETQPLITTLFHPTNYKKEILYIGMCILYKKGKSLHYVPIGLFRAKQKKKGASFRVKQVKLSGIPYDIIVKEKYCFILTALEKKDKEGKKQFVNQVLVTENFKTYKPLAKFSSDSFARSFEIFEGSIYVGLGCGWNEEEKSAGTVMRIEMPSEWQKKINKTK